MALTYDGMDIRFQLRLECNNDAFEDTDSECDAEVARILRDLADRVDAGKIRIPVGARSITESLIDINGNIVGGAGYYRADLIEKG